MSEELVRLGHLEAELRAVESVLTERDVDKKTIGYIIADLFLSRLKTGQTKWPD